MNDEGERVEVRNKHQQIGNAYFRKLNLEVCTRVRGKTQIGTGSQIFREEGFLCECIGSLVVGIIMKPMIRLRMKTNMGEIKVGNVKRS